MMVTNTRSQAVHSLAAEVLVTACGIELAIADEADTYANLTYGGARFKAADDGEIVSCLHCHRALEMRR